VTHGKRRPDIDALLAGAIFSDADMVELLRDLTPNPADICGKLQF
jgi:hypothetical protein